MADAAESAGLAAQAEDSPAGLRIISEHCPFGDVAIEHPVICAVDRGMVKGMLESLYGTTDTTTESSRATGDPTCITTVG